MTQQRADDRQAEPGPGGDAGEAVAEVVQADVVEPSSRPDAPPGLLQVDQVGAGERADDSYSSAKLS